MLSVLTHNAVGDGRTECTTAIQAAINAQFAAGVFHGLPEMPLRDIVMHDVDIQMNPDAHEGETAMASTIPKMSKRAFFCKHVSGLHLQSVRVEGHEGPLVDAEHCEGVHVDTLITE
jgi:hypothetical protein